MAIAVAVAGALALASAPATAQTRLTKTDLEIRTLSTHPDTVSGGDVLVLIKMPGSLASDKVSVMLNGRDVNPAFRVAEEPNSLVGLVLVSGFRACEKLRPFTAEHAEHAENS